MYISIGYNTWGMTNGSFAGKIISDLILDRNNRYIELFSPNHLGQYQILLHHRPSFDQLRWTGRFQPMACKHRRQRTKYFEVY